MLQYFGAFVWGLVVLFSAFGWGSLIATVLYPQCRRDFGHCAVWGLSLELVLGGVLNLASLATVPVLIAMVGTGMLVFLLAARGFWRSFLDSINRWFGFLRKNRLGVAVTLLIGMLLAVRYAASVWTIRFNADDDLHGYMIYPAKIVQLGTMGADPFSVRRCATGLGGTYLLHAIFLSTLSYENLQILDNGLGLLILFIQFAGLCRDQDWPLASTLPPLFLIAIVPPPQVNVSSLLLVGAFLLSLVRLLADNRTEWHPFSFRGTLLMALVAAAGCTLKAPAIAGIGVLMITYYFVALIFDRRRHAFLSMILFGLEYLAFISPYMISLHASAGTLLYPVFGRGHDALPSPVQDMEAWSMIKVIAYSLPYFAALGLSVWYIALSKPLFMTQRIRTALVALFACAALGSLAVGFGTGGFGFARYPYGFTFPALLVLVALGYAVHSLEPSRGISRAALVIGVLAALALFAGGVTWGLRRHVYRDWIADIRSGLAEQPLFSASERKRTTATQSAIPANAPFFAVVDRPLLLDWRRNTIYFSDYVGVWSLPPYIPVHQGPEALRAYLLGLGIRYVAFSYNAPFVHGRDEALLWINGPGYFYPWLKAVARRSLDVTDNMTLLARQYLHLYDDQDGYVLDLQTPAPAQR